MKVSELFRKNPKTPVFDHSNYRLFKRISAVPGTSNNQGSTVCITLNNILDKLTPSLPYIMHAIRGEKIRLF